MSTARNALEEVISISGQLVCQEPLHLGGLELSVSTDMPFALDVEGKPYLPGSSLAGMLRAACVSDQEARELFGFGDPKSIEGRASRVWAEDAQLESDAGMELHDHVRIDRYSGTAAHQAKFDVEAVPAGSSFKFEMTIERRRGDQDLSAVLLNVLAQLSSGELSLGRGKQRGYGSVKLENPLVRRQLWSKTEGILEAVFGRAEESEALPRSSASARLLITLPFKAQGPLMVKASYGGADVDMLPRTAKNVDRKYVLMLPGSSIKGALRSHAEKIVRLRLGTAVNDVATKIEAAIAQVNLPLVDLLFGTPRAAQDGKHAKTDQENSVKAGMLGLAGSLKIKTLYAAPNSTWTELVAPKLKSKDEPLTKHLAALKSNGLRKDPTANNQGPQVDVAYHVAIDRWTGGAAENMLYTAVEPWGIDWPAIEITLDTAALKARAVHAYGGNAPLVERAALVLLWHVLNDFCEGLIPLGFGTTRGYGHVEAKPQSVEFVGPGGLCGATNLASLNTLAGQKEALQDFKGAWSKPELWKRVFKKSSLSANVRSTPTMQPEEAMETSS
jgi:CRISPR/Cas system CSM-associated protein Csm3 (group 7 of RAMP superfamily)